MTIGRIIEPNEAANNKPKNGNSYQTVGQISFIGPYKIAMSPCKRFGQDMPNSTENTNGT